MLGDLLDVEGGGEEADKGHVLTSGPEDMAGVPFSEGEAWKRGGITRKYVECNGT